MKKHKKIQKNLVDRLKSYGYKVSENIECYDDSEGRVIGEIDVLAYARNDRLITPRIYEVKENARGVQHGVHQLKRLRDYFSSRSKLPPPKLIIVYDNSMHIRRVR